MPSNAGDNLQHDRVSSDVGQVHQVRCAKIVPISRPRSQQVDLSACGAKRTVISGGRLDGKRGHRLMATLMSHQTARRGPAAIGATVENSDRDSWFEAA